MADDVESNIRINIDTDAALASIKNLQRQISAFHSSMAQASATARAQAANMQQNLINNINATGKFEASIKSIKSETESFTESLEKNKFSMGEYFRYAGGASKTFGKLFKSEFATITKVAKERVAELQTQYISLGKDASGALKAIKVKPLALDMDNLATKTAMAAQKQQILNQLIRQGSTQMVNWGKNTQWAGRQLMVGFTIPITMLGTTASKVFMDLEKQILRLKRVYGDLGTSMADTDKMVSQIRALAVEFTKYGVSVEKTMGLAADAAAMGKQGVDLLAQVSQANRLAVLGGVEQSQALETTISLTNAFGTSADKLAGKIDFLNAVENQTVTSIEDLTTAIPKAGPVIEQLGGSVEDLAFFLTAMKEGGINASEGANALKSGLAAMINPTGKASEMLKGFGINIRGIVDSNAGNVKGTVIGLAQALDKLDPLNRARAIEQMFGKFQFARISTLFKNVVDEGSQANRVLELTKNSSQELAALSQRELKRVEDSPMYKYQKAMENFKLSLAPVGEAFLKMATPIIEIATKMLKWFNGLSEGWKNIAMGATVFLGVIGPAAIMAIGLFANALGNIWKIFGSIKAAFNRTSNPVGDLASRVQYLTQEQIEASAVAASLDQAHAKLSQRFTSEASAIQALIVEYQRAANAAQGFMGVTQQAAGAQRMVPTVIQSTTGRRAGSSGGTVQNYATGGMIRGRGTGTSDSIPAMLSNGEAVIPAKSVSKHPELVTSLISGNLPGYAGGFNPFGGMLKRSRIATRTTADDLISMILGSGQYSSGFETQRGADWLTRSGRPNEAQIALRAQMERDAMGLSAFGTPAAQRPTYGSVATVSKLAMFLNKLFGGAAGKQFNETTDPTSSALNRYGDVSLIGKKDLNKRSTVFAGDILQQYKMFPQKFNKPGFVLPSMVGSSNESLENQGNFKVFNNPFGKAYTDKNGTMFANPGVPHIEAHTKGGFSVDEIQRILVQNPEKIPAIEAALASRGLKIPVARFATGGVAGLPQGFLSAPTPEETQAGVSFVQASWLAQLEKRKSLESLVNKSRIPNGSVMYRVPTIRQNQELSTKRIGDIVDLGSRFSSVADQTQLQAIGMTAAGKLDTGNRNAAVNTILKLTAGYEMPGIMNHGNYNPDYKKQAFGDRAEAYPFQSEGILPPGLKGKITNITNDGRVNVVEVLLAQLAKGGIITKLATGGILRGPGTGTSDSIPAMLSTGEAVIPAKSVAKHRGLVDGLVSGNIPGFSQGTAGAASEGKRPLTFQGMGGDLSHFGPGISSTVAELQKMLEVAGNTKGLEALAKKIKDLGLKADDTVNVFDNRVMDLPSSLNRKFGKGNSVEIEEVIAGVRKAGTNAHSQLIYEMKQMGATDEEITQLVTDITNDIEAGLDKLGTGVKLHSDKFNEIVQAAYESNIEKQDKAGKTSSKKAYSRMQEVTAFSTAGKDSHNRRPLNAADHENPAYKVTARRVDNQRSVAAEVLGKSAFTDVSKMSWNKDDRLVAQSIANKITPDQVNELAAVDSKDYGKRSQLLKQFAGVADNKAQIPAMKSAEADASAYTQTFNNEVKTKGKDPYELIRHRNSPHQLTGQDAMDDANSYNNVLDDAMAPPKMPGSRRVSSPATGGIPGLANIPGVQPIINQTMMDEMGNQIIDPKMIDESVAPAAKLKDKLKAGILDMFEGTADEIKSKAKKKGLEIGQSIMDRISGKDVEKRLQTPILDAEGNPMASKTNKLEDYTGTISYSAEGLATDEDGNVMVDPKTGKPYTQKQVEKIGKKLNRKARSAKIAGGVRNMSGGLMMASGMLSTLPDQIIGPEIKQGMQKAMVPLGAMTTAMSMIPGTAGLVIGGLVGVGSALWMMKEALDAEREASYQLAQSMGVGKDAMQKFANFTGKATSTEVMDLRQQQNQAIFQIKPGKNKFGDTFFQSEEGKAMLTATKTQIAKFGKDVAAEKIGNQLSTAVATGVMNKKQAGSIALALGQQLKDYNFTLGVSAKMLELTGPAGEDLTKEPLQIEVVQKITSGTRQDTVKSLNALTKHVENYVSAKSNPLVSWLSVWNTAELARNEGEAASAISSQIEQQNALIDTFDAQYQKRIDNLRAQGKINEAEKLQSEYMEKRKPILENNERQMKSVIDKIRELRSTDIGIDSFAAIQGKLTEGAKKKFENESQEVKDKANSLLDNIYKKPGLNVQTRIMFTVGIGNGSLDMEDINKFYNMYQSDGKTFNIVGKVMLEDGTRAGGQLSRLLTMFDDKENGAAFAIEIQRMDSSAAKDALNFFDNLSKYSSVTEMKVILDFYSDPKNMKMFKDGMLAYDKFTKGKKVKGDTLLTILKQDFKIDKAGLAEFKANNDYFDSLDAVQQKTYIQAFITSYQTMTTEEAESSLNTRGVDPKGFFGDYTAEQKSKEKARLAVEDAKRLTEQMKLAGLFDGSNTPSTPSGGGAAGSFLDDLIKRIRDATKSTQKLTEGLKATKDALKKLSKDADLFNKADGLNRKLRDLGVERGLRDQILGLSKEEFNSVKKTLFVYDKTGKKIVGLKKDFQSIVDLAKGVVIEEGRVSARNDVKDLKEKVSAYQKLIAMGADAATAAELVSDAYMVEAVNANKNSEALKELIALKKEQIRLNEVLSAQQNLDKAAADAQVKKNLPAILEAAKNAGLGDKQLQEIINNADLQKILNDQFVTLGAINFDDARVQQALQDAVDLANIDAKIKTFTIEGMQSTFDTAYGMVQDAFSAKETQIELTFKPKIDAQQKIVDAAQEQIDGINEKIDLYNRDLEKMQEQEDAINEKYDKRNEALDKIQKANDAIAKQQKSQLTIADALSQGDIAAAAKAVQDERAQYATDSVQTQRDIYDEQRKSELEAVRNAQGLTRKEIDKAIKALNEEIYQIQKNTLEPAQKQIELLNKQKQEQIESLTILGKTKTQWEEIKNSIDLARTSSEEYLAKIQAALDLVQKLIDKYKELGATAPAVPVPTDTTGPGTAPNGQTPLPTDENGNVTVPPRSRPGGPMLIAAKGGMVPQFFAAGGFAIGTDTVPAMLTPGEFIMSKYAVAAYGTDTMRAINNGSFSGGSVYNSYEVNVNVRSDADPDSIARAVMTKINQLDSQRIRGNRI